MTTAVVEGAHSREDVRHHACWTTPTAVRGRAIVFRLGWSLAPPQQRVCLPSGRRRAGLEQEARDADVREAVGDLHRRAAIRSNQGRETDPQNDEAVGAHDERPVQLVEPGGQQETLLALHTLVDLFGTLSWLCDEDFGDEAELAGRRSLMVLGRTSRPVAVELWHVDAPNLALAAAVLVVFRLHQVRLLSYPRRRRRHGHLACDGAGAIRVGLLHHVLDPNEDVVPTRGAPDAASHVHVAEEPLLLHAGHHSAVHLHVCDEATAAESFVVRQEQVTVDDGSSDGSPLRHGPGDGRVLEVHPLHRPPEVVRGVAICPVERTDSLHLHIVGSCAHAEHAGVVADRDHEVLWVGTWRQQHGVAVPVEVPLPPLLLAPDVVDDVLQVLVLRPQDLHVLQPVVPPRRLLLLFRLLLVGLPLLAPVAGRLFLHGCRE
mmetsp:Transcript_119765/g.298784  ORF Transcript_119765/g.298784 Transcript_119765/m.298784 type:complete len:432 (-) Transcript_119765:220-1515(-)